MARAHPAPQRTRKPRGQGHERPAEILDAAKQMFLTEGFQSFTTRKLAERVGLSQTGLYIYFKTKDEILDAICQRTYEATLRRYRQIEAEYADDLDRFAAMLRHSIQAGLAAPEEYQIIYMTRRKLLHGAEELAKPTEQQSRGVRIVVWQRDLVARLIASGVFRPMDPGVATQIVLAAPHGLVSRLIAWPDFPWVDREILTAALIEVFTSGLMARS